MKRGQLREKSLDRKVYFSDGYFAAKQLYSQVQQIHDVCAYKPKDVIEVGVGNGFTSHFLKRAGYNVTTVDINANLDPDICCSLDQLAPRLDGRTFDLAVCCEVLEHMPFADFEGNLRILRSISDQLYLTLPNYSKSYGMGGLVQFPKISKYLSLYIDFPTNRALCGEHFWEVGSNKESKKCRIMDILSSYYGKISFSRYALNPYHLAFFCQR